MALHRDDLTSHDGERVFDDELVDDYAPTTISRNPRSALALAAERGFRADHVHVGDLLAGKYRVERVHKRGALGVTVEAMHTQLGQRVAIRLLAADPRAYPEASARFLRGARLAVQFQNEHTSRILDIGTLESGAPYVVAELLSGSDLQRVLRVREWLAVPDAVDYLLQACEALSEAHGQGIVHRNLKPTNLFLARRDGDKKLVVLDFGVSEDPLSDAAINLGGIGGAAAALAYLAPEQIRDPSTVDARADIWALGAILHEMLTGCALYEAPTVPGLLAMIAADPPVPVSHLRPEISAELENVVLVCLAKDRDERYASVGALASALRPFASAAGHESAERMAGVRGRPSRTTRPPPLPKAATRAIVRVPQPPKPGPAPAAAASSSPLASRRVGELALTALGLAAAGALGVYVAIHAMEGALAAAVRPRTVVADLSPALPATTVLPAAPAAVAPVAVAPVAVAPVAVAAATPPSVAVAPQPSLPSAVVSKPIVLQAASRPPAAPIRRPSAKAPAVDAAVVADAKPVATKSAPAHGLFDDSN